MMESTYIMTDSAAAAAAAPMPCREPRAALERAELVRGARAVVPIAIAATLFGVSYGVLARDAGLGIAAPIVMSFTTFAGSAQFAAAGVMEQGGALAAAILAAVLLNLRYLAIGISVAPALRGGLLRRLGEAQLAVDESWAVSQEDGRVVRGRLIGAGLTLMVAWGGGTILGVLGGGALGDPEAYGLDAMFPALFLALLVGLVKDRRTLRAALAGGAIALLLLPFAPAGVPVIAAVAGVFAAGRAASEPVEGS
jgi:4-azaleucine resistance transporter AzlC